MTKPLNNRNAFNRLSLFVNDNCRSSGSGLVFNDCDHILSTEKIIRKDHIDGVIYDYKLKRLMLVEEKTEIAGNMSRSQIESYAITDYCYRTALPTLDITYCGFSLIKWRSNNVDDGAFINGQPVDKNTLINHLNLYEIVEGEFHPLKRSQDYMVEMAILR